MPRLDRHLVKAREERKRGDASDWNAAIEQVIANLHTRQRSFVLDASRHVAALVGRGGGKTTGVRARLFYRLLTIPNAKLLYIASSRGQAEELMWAPLKDLFAEHGIVAKWNETKLKVTVARNGAQLILAGADNKKEIEKFRGLPHHEVAIDECASYSIKLLENLIDRVIGPRLGDYNGSLVLIGTPGHILDGEFYEVTRTGSERSYLWDDRDHPDYAEAHLFWSVHKWTLRDGAAEGIEAMQSLWAAALAKKALKGWSDKNPIWRREYLGEWAADDTENVFRYRIHDDDGNPFNQWSPTFRTGTRVAELPTLHTHADQLAPSLRHRDWRYVVGLDLGHSDPFSCQVFAYSPTDRHLWHVYEYEKKQMFAKSIAQLLLGDELNHNNLGGLFGIIGWPDAIVADTAGLGGAILEDLRRVYGISIKPAEKKQKFDNIELFNGDLVDQRIFVMKGSKLEAQLIHLQWDIDDFGRMKEARNQPNHSTDAAIYARRHALHLFGEAEPQPPPDETPASRAAALNQWARESEERAAHPPTNEFSDYISGPGDFSRFL